MSGPNVMQGYNNLPDASAEVFFDVDGKRYLLYIQKVLYEKKIAKTKTKPVSKAGMPAAVGTPAGHGRSYPTPRLYQVLYLS